MRKYPGLLPWFTGLLIMGVDQATKLYARQVNQAILNTGGVLSLGEEWNWTLLMLGVIGVLAWYIKQHPPSNFIEKTSWMIIFSSGISNLIDRLWFGGVWDWIYYPVLNVTGNLADVTLGVGIILVIGMDAGLFKKAPLEK